MALIVRHKIIYMNVGNRRYKHIELTLDITSTSIMEQPRLRNWMTPDSTISDFIDLTADDDVTRATPDSTTTDYIDLTADDDDSTDVSSNSSTP